MDGQVLRYRVLDVIHTSDYELTQREISERLNISTSTANFTIRLLAAEGFIKISEDTKISQGQGRRLKYSLSPKGISHKSSLARDFLERHIDLYHAAREDLLRDLEKIVRDRVKSASIYGWSPITESAMLFLLLEGIGVSAIYVARATVVGHWHGVPMRLIDEFQPDCDLLVLMEHLPKAIAKRIGVRMQACFPRQ